MRLVARLVSLFKDPSSEAQKTVADINADIDRVLSSKVSDDTYVSRIANSFPDYLSTEELQYWLNKADETLKSVSVESIEKNQCVDEIIAESGGDFLLAQEKLALSSKSKSDIKSIYYEMLGEACKQVLQLNGNYDPELLKILKLEEVFAKWKDHADDLKSLLIGSVCNNLLVSKFLSDVVSIDSRHVDLSEVKQVLIRLEFNRLVKEKQLIKHEINRIIEERILCANYVNSYLMCGEFNAELGKLLLKKVDNVEIKNRALLGVYKFFTRLADADEERILKYIGLHYPEIASEITARIICHEIAEEGEFTRSVRVLGSLNAKALALETLWPSSPEKMLRSDLSLKDIGNNVVHEAYLVNHDKQNKHRGLN